MYELAHNYLKKKQPLKPCIFPKAINFLKKNGMVLLLLFKLELLHIRKVLHLNSKLWRNQSLHFRDLLSL